MLSGKSLWSVDACVVTLCSVHTVCSCVCLDARTSDIVWCNFLWYTLYYIVFTCVLCIGAHLCVAYSLHLCGRLCGTPVYCILCGAPQLCLCGAPVGDLNSPLNWSRKLKFAAVCFNLLNAYFESTEGADWAKLDEAHGAWSSENYTPEIIHSALKS